MTQVHLSFTFAVFKSRASKNKDQNNTHHLTHLFLSGEKGNQFCIHENKGSVTSIDIVSLFFNTLSLIIVLRKGLDR